MSVGEDEILVTSGPGQALELINQILCEPGDTVIMEEFTYQGAMNRLRARVVNVVGAKLDNGGLDIDALAEQLDKLKKVERCRSSSTRFRQCKTRRLPC